MKFTFLLGAYLRFSILSAIVLFTGIHGAFAANVVSDFSATQNPNGAYQYGQETTLGHNFSLLEQSMSGAGYAGYQSSSHFGAVIYGVDGSQSGNGTVIFSPGYVNLGPAKDGAYAVLRYTTADAGVFNINGVFRGQGTHGATVDVHVLLNNNSQFDSSVDGTGDPSATAFALDGIYLNAGDTVDFAVGTGGNGYEYDNTGLKATISAADVSTPEPCSVLLMGGGLVALLGLRRRRLSL